MATKLGSILNTCRNLLKYPLVKTNLYTNVRCLHISSAILSDDRHTGRKWSEEDYLDMEIFSRMGEFELERKKAEHEKKLAEEKAHRIHLSELKKERKQQLKGLKFRFTDEERRSQHHIDYVDCQGIKREGRRLSDSEYRPWLYGKKAIFKKKRRSLISSPLNRRGLNEPVNDKYALSGELDEFKSRKFATTAPAGLDLTTAITISSDPHIVKLTKLFMRKGMKDQARMHMTKAIETVKRIQVKKYHNSTEEERESIILDPQIIVEKAIENTTPVLVLGSIKRGGYSYQVPMPPSDKRKKFIAMKWLLEAALPGKRGRNYVSTCFHDRFANVLIDAADKKGKGFQKKIDMHTMCENNRAYAHYRWKG